MEIFSTFFQFPKFVIFHGVLLLSGEPLGITQLNFGFEYKYMVEGSTFGLSLQLKCEILLLLIS